MADHKKIYPEAQNNPDFPKIEEDILAYWQDNRIFEKSVEQRDGQDEFVFYDGPPFANGLPHYGHLVTGYVKDIIPRYKTMKGYKVERRFGWDCHGLPAELQAEKELGISGRLEIQDYGIKKYNDHCRKSVLRFTKEWEYYVTRQARWVDFENDYKTLDTNFMESVLWAFKTLHDKGLIYEDYRVVPYSWAVESPLSNFETRLDNSYRSRQDPAVTVRFKLDKGIGADGKEADTDTYILAWTTTPWTLPSHLALAVGEEIDYAVMAKDGAHYILAEAAVERYQKEFEDAEQIATIPGKDLTGRHYEPVFPYFKYTENAFHVLPGEFVSTEDGTGIVHMAPGFGEDDLNTCRAYKIPVVVPVDSKGRFTSEVPDYEGELVFDANKAIIKRLKDEGKLVRHETIDHNYPHCWRTDEPLIYKAINSWYLSVTEFKDRMVKLNHDNINWIPDHVRDGQFGRWLENARDWNIARNRFWGTPIPVWQSDNPDFPRTDVYGSIEELEKDFGIKIDDLHRPMIDELTRPNPDDPSGQSTMRRVEDVLDCWFESGSMPFAQVHYPFENKEWFESHFPGDFIVEYIAQTRGWFYTLMVLATALFDKNPFKNCICHGVVLDEDRAKLSKSKDNYPDPKEVFDQYGSDCLRWYMVSSPLMTGGDLSISHDGKEIGQTRNQIVNPIWNAYSFFTLYANADGIKGNVITPDQVTNTLDKYILGKIHQLVESVETHLDHYEIPAACDEIQEFLGALTNWYIRRSRDRFWKAEKDTDKQQAYDTLYTALITLCKVAAPFLPFVTEKVYKNLTGEDSVHLADWPELATENIHSDLVQQMDGVRDVCSATLAIRERENLRVRLPLNRLVVAAPEAQNLESFTDLVKDEVNVKEVVLTDDLGAYGELQLKVNPAIGKRLKGAMKDVMAASKQGEWTDNGDDTVTVAGQTLSLNDNDYSMQLVTDDGTTAEPIWGTGAVILDTVVTPELEREGLARDLVRLIQTTRKDADLDISDRIDLELDLPEKLVEAAKEHEDFIKSETLALSLSLSVSGSASYTGEHELGGSPVKIAVSKSRKAA